MVNLAFKMERIRKIKEFSELSESGIQTLGKFRKKCSRLSEENKLTVFHEDRASRLWKQFVTIRKQPELPEKLAPEKLFAPGSSLSGSW